MDMNETRTQIDKIDDVIREAFAKRMELCASLAEYKKENNLPVAYPGREREIVARLTKDMDSRMAMGFYLT